MFPDVAQIQLVCLIDSFISRIIALHTALLLKQVSQWRLPVSNTVLKNVFIFELQSEFSDNIFPFHCFFCTIGFGVYETANL